MWIGRERRKWDSVVGVRRNKKSARRNESRGGVNRVRLKRERVAKEKGEMGRAVLALQGEGK